MFSTATLVGAARSAVRHRPLGLAFDVVEFADLPSAKQTLVQPQFPGYSLPSKRNGFMTDVGFLEGRPAAGI